MRAVPTRPPLRDTRTSTDNPFAGAPPDAGEAGMPLLPAEWLDETLARARTLLHRDDPFMQALERQREPMV